MQYQQFTQAAVTPPHHNVNLNALAGQQFTPIHACQPFYAGNLSLNVPQNVQVPVQGMGGHGILAPYGQTPNAAAAGDAIPPHIKTYIDSNLELMKNYLNGTMEGAMSSMETRLNARMIALETAFAKQKKQLISNTYKQVFKKFYELLVQRQIYTAALTQSRTQNQQKRTNTKFSLTNVHFYNPYKTEESILDGNKYAIEAYNSWKDIESSEFREAFSQIDVEAPNYQLPNGYFFWEVGYTVQFGNYDSSTGIYRLNLQRGI